jgi:hypothetical protein
MGARQVLYCLSHSSSPLFLLWLFWTWVLLFAQVSLDYSPLFYASHSGWNDRSVPPCPTIGQGEILPVYCPGWAPTMILPISASQVARVTVVSHQHPACTQFFSDAKNTWCFPACLMPWLCEIISSSERRQRLGRRITCPTLCLSCLSLCTH